MNFSCILAILEGPLDNDENISLIVNFGVISAFVI